MSYPRIRGSNVLPASIEVLTAVFIGGMATGIILLAVVTVPTTDKLRQTVGKLNIDNRYLRAEIEKHKTKKRS